MTQPPTSHTAAVSMINKEIGAARWLVQSLLSRRNGMAPISTLLPELLARIFQFLILGDIALFSVPVMGWFEATHVCQHWRQVALDDSSLWARVTGFSPSPEWISTLVHARNALLDINLVGMLDPKLLSKFPPHIPHPCQLRLRNLCMHHSQRVKDICALEAPVLEHFELGISTVHNFSFILPAPSTPLTPSLSVGLLCSSVLSATSSGHPTSNATSLYPYHDLFSPARPSSFLGPPGLSPPSSTTNRGVGPGGNSSTPDTPGSTITYHGVCLTT